MSREWSMSPFDPLLTSSLISRHDFLLENDLLLSENPSIPAAAISKA